MYQQGSEVSVATLDDSLQILLSATGMLLWDKTKPGRHLTTVVEVLRVANGGDQRIGGDRTNAWDVRTLAADIAAAMPRSNLYFKFIDLTIQFLEMVQQPLNEYPKRSRQLVAGIFTRSSTPGHCTHQRHPIPRTGKSVGSVESWQAIWAKVCHPQRRHG